MSRFADDIERARTEGRAAVNLYPHGIVEALEAMDLADEAERVDGREWVYVVASKHLIRDICRRLLGDDE